MKVIAFFIIFLQYFNPEESASAALTFSQRTWIWQSRAVYQLERVVTFDPNQVTSLDDLMKIIYECKQPDELNRVSNDSLECLFYTTVSIFFK